MNKDKLLGMLIIISITTLSNKLGKDLWNAKITCNKLNLKN